MNQKYRNKITYLSFLLAILIVVRHSNGIGTYTLHYQSLLFFEQFISDATDIVVSIFFALSGFLFYQNFEYSKLKTKFISRFYSLIIPFIIWNLFGFFFFYTINTIPFVAAHTNNTIPTYNSFCKFCYDVFITTSYNGPTWFLLNLIIYTGITPPLAKTLMSNKIIGICVLFVFYITGLYLNSRLLLCYVTYLFGCYMALNYKDVCQSQYNNKLVILSTALLISSLFAQTLLKLPQSYTIVPLRIIQIVLVWISSDVLAQEKMPRWWIQLSFFIYLSHHMILESIEKIFLIVLGDTTIGAIIDLIFAPTLTISIIITFAFFLRKSCSFWKVINGGRG